MRKHEDSKGGIAGWFAILDDGTTLAESDGVAWGAVRDRVVGLSLSAGGATVSLPRDMAPYAQGKTASCPVAGGEAKVESRWIGFASPSGDRVVARVSEATGRISIEVFGDDPIGDDKKV